MADIMFCGILNITANKHLSDITMHRGCRNNSSVNKQNCTAQIYQQEGSALYTKNWNMLSCILFVTICWDSDMTVPPASAQTLQEIKNAFTV